MAVSSYMRVDETGRPQAQLRPEFFMDSVKDEAASMAAGREIFREIESVKIIIPGMTATVVVHRVNQGHVQRWPDAYDAFKRGLEMPITGTPIEVWPILNRAMIAELRHHEIRTVEELALISDNAVSRLGPGAMKLREHARAFLDDAAHEALRTKLEALCDQQSSRIAALEGQIEQMNRALLLISDENRRYAEEANYRRLGGIPAGEMPARMPVYRPEGYPPPPPGYANEVGEFAQAQYDPRVMPPAPGPVRSALDDVADIPFSSRRAPGGDWRMPGSEPPPPAPALPRDEGNIAAEIAAELAGRARVGEAALAPRNYTPPAPAHFVPPA